MQYSFSQTFGKGVNLLYASPTPSFKNPSKVNSQSRSMSRSHSGSRDIGQSNNRSPVLQSYPSKQINLMPACFDRRLFIERLSKQKANNKLNQDTFRQRELKIQKQINQVDGLNERMKNLLNQLRRQHSHDVKNFSQKKQTNTPQPKNRQAYNDNNKQNITRIDRCQSSTTIKKQNLPNWFVNNKQKDLKQNMMQKQNKILETQNKGLEFGSRQNSSAKLDRCLIEQNRIKYKNRLQNKFIDEKQQSNIKQRKKLFSFFQDKNKQKYNKKYQQQSSTFIKVSSTNCQNINLANSNLKGKIYTSQMYEKYKNKDKDKDNGIKKFSGSCQVNLQQTSNNKNKLQRQGLLKNKVKTIQSQIDTNGIQIHYDQSQNQIQQVSYVQQEDPPEQKQHQQLIFRAFYDKDKKVQENKEIKCCNCGNKKNNTTNTYQYVSFNTKQGSIQNTDRSGGFQNKIKRISEKIQNYQKKVSGLNIGLASFDKFQSKLPYQSYKNTQLKQKQQPNQKLIQIASYKKVPQKKKQPSIQCNLKDYQGQSGHLRTVTPTWAFDLIKDKQQEQSSQTQKKHRTTLTKKEINNTLNETTQQLTTKRKEKYMKQEKEIFNISLKERMSHKLGVSDCAQKFTKQIELDQQFRKSKKQFAKLPEDIPKISKNKWYYLQKTFMAQGKLIRNKFIQVQIKNMSIKQIFGLTDEQADPFYSIAVQDLKEYEQTINQCVQCFIKSETHFYENLYQSFSNKQLEELFSGKLRSKQQQNIQLDELTLMISNATKINHKCRDIYLIFKRILLKMGKIQTISNDKSLLQQSVSLNQLIKYFSHEQKQKEKTKQRVKKSSIDYYNQQESIKSKKTIRSLKSDKNKSDKF